MPVFSGSSIGSNTSEAYNLEMKIVSFSLTNKTGGAITATVGITYGSTFDVIYNKPLAAAGASGCEYVYPGGEILLPPYNQIFVSVSGNCDFYFSIIPTK